MRGLFLAFWLTGCRSLGDWQPVEVHGGLLVLDTEVGDGVPVRCLIDTGASATFVRSDLSPSGDPVMAIGDRELPIAALSAPSFDPVLDAIGAPLGGIDCLLGWDSVENSPFTIDYANAQVRLSPKGHRDRRVDETLGDELTVPLAFTEPIPMIEVEIQGITALLGVDTGAQAALLDPSLFDRLPDPPQTSAAQVITPDGVLPAEFGVLETLSIGGVPHDGVDFVSYASIQIQAVVDEGWPIDGLIGASSLVRHLVTFDDERSELTLQPYDAATQEALVDEIRVALTSQRSTSPTVRMW